MATKETTQTFLKSEPIDAVRAQLHSETVAIARGAATDDTVQQLLEEVKRLRYVPDEPWRSQSGSRRPLYIGNPRTTPERVLLSRPGLLALHGVSEELDTLFHGIDPKLYPSLNRVVVNRLKESDSRPGYNKTPAIHDHLDPDHYRGVVAAVSLAPAVLRLSEATSDGRRGRFIRNEELETGDIGFFLCKDAAEALGVERPMHAVTASVPERFSPTYSHSVHPPLNTAGIFVRARQHFQKPA